MSLVRTAGCLCSSHVDKCQVRPTSQDICWVLCSRLAAYAYQFRYINNMRSTICAPQLGKQTYETPVEQVPCSHVAAYSDQTQGIVHMSFHIWITDNPFEIAVGVQNVGYGNWIGQVVVCCAHMWLNTKTKSKVLATWVSTLWSPTAFVLLKRAVDDQMWKLIEPSCQVLCSHVAAYSEQAQGLGHMRFHLVITHRPFKKGPWVIKCGNSFWPTLSCTMLTCSCTCAYNIL